MAVLTGLLRNMKGEKMKAFKAKMNQLCLAYGKEMNDPLMAIYWPIASEYGEERFCKACDRHLYSGDESSSFWPKPGDIVRRLEGTKTDKAQLAWNEVIVMMRKYGAYATVQFNDPKTADVIRRMGGWPHLCRTSLEEMPFREREFCRFYEAIKQPSNEQVLAGLHDINNLQGGHEAQELKQLKEIKLIGE